MDKLDGEQLKSFLKALRITDDTVLFVDLNVIDTRTLQNCKTLPSGLLIVAVNGEPNVEAMTVSELEGILERKRARIAGA